MIRLQLTIGFGKGDKLLPKSLIAINRTIDENMISKMPKKIKIKLTCIISFLGRNSNLIKWRMMIKNCKITRRNS